MSSTPAGWKSPKVTWKGGDIPLPSDFNRIEGNPMASEIGARTLDPSQAPSGNTGSLRQILDWFANRLKAISGEANWYDNPSQSLKSHRDATSGIHGATSAATASRLVVRDAAGRAQFAAPSATADAATKGYVDGQFPLPVSQLKKAQGSASTASFAVHQYAFVSVQTSGNSTLLDYQRGAAVGGYRPGGDTATRRMMGALRSSTESGNTTVGNYHIGTITWDYLTASGHPRVWAEVDGRGEIVAMWEAEDPADREFPDEPPFEPGEGRILVPVEPPEPELLDSVAHRLGRSSIPPGFQRSIYRADPPNKVARVMLAHQLAERGLEEPKDVRDAFSFSDRDRRYWYLQLYFRAASRLLHDHRSSTLIPLYREMCRVDKRTGRLELR